MMREKRAKLIMYIIQNLNINLILKFDDLGVIRVK